MDRPPMTAPPPPPPKPMQGKHGKQKPQGIMIPLMPPPALPPMPPPPWSISKRTHKISPMGAIIESNELTVMGVDLEKCKKTFNEMWEKK